MHGGSPSVTVWGIGSLQCTGHFEQRLEVKHSGVAGADKTRRWVG